MCVLVADLFLLFPLGSDHTACAVYGAGGGLCFVQQRAVKGNPVHSMQVGRVLARRHVYALIP